jgi:hypothetical protein
MLEHRPVVVHEPLGDLSVALLEFLQLVAGPLG